MALSICIVTQQLGQVISGIGLHASHLARRLPADGHRVVVVAPADQRPPGELPYTFIGVPPPLLRGSQARWLSLSLSFARTLARLEHQMRFDIVHFTDAREALLCRSGAPIVGNINDTYAAELRAPVYYRRYYADWAQRWAYYRFVQGCERAVLPRLAAVIANSQYTAAAVDRAYHVPADRLHICYKAVEPAHFERARRLRASVPPHPPQVLFVGGNMQRKGLPTLIRAAGTLRPLLPDVAYRVVGRDAAQPRMEALCQAEGVADRFTFLGWRSQDDLQALYAQADVFVLPALTEAFGVVLLEAMAAGVPVVATRVGGIPEIVEHGRNGLLVLPGDPVALAQALAVLVPNQPLRERLQAAGAGTARLFGVDRMLACTYQVYSTMARVA